MFSAPEAQAKFPETLSRLPRPALLLVLRFSYRNGTSPIHVIDIARQHLKDEIFSKLE